MSKFQLGKLWYPFAFVFLLQLANLFLEHACKAVPEDRKGIALPLLPSHISVPDRTKFFLLFWLLLMKSNGWVQPFLTSSWFPEMWEGSFCMQLGHSWCSNSHFLFFSEGDPRVHRNFFIKNTRMSSSYNLYCDKLIQKWTFSSRGSIVYPTLVYFSNIAYLDLESYNFANNFINACSNQNPSQ